MCLLNILVLDSAFFVLMYSVSVKNRSVCVCVPLSLCSADTEFSLSLNGEEPLTDTGQTLSSCGVVSGDMISVILPRTDSSASSPSPSSRRTHAVPAVQQNTPESPAALGTHEVSAEMYTIQTF